MAVNKRLIGGAAAAGALVPSEHFGVVLYEGDGSSSHSINGGKFGAAFYGNGSNSRIDSTSIGAWPSGNAPRSISFWMYSDSYADGGIVAYGTAASNQGFAFYIGSSQLIMTFYAVNANINYALSTGQWYHVVATHDGTTFKAYINGSEEYSDTRTLNTGTAGFRVGGVPWNNSSEFFNGKIDQVRIFQKALSSSEVSTLYAETVDTVESLDPLSEDTTDTLQVLGDSSCTSLYRFENNEDDESGNYDGTGSQVQYSAGRYGQAIKLGVDANNSYVDITTATTPTTSTLSLWFKTSENDSNWTLIVDGGGSRSADTGYAIFRSGDGGYINLYFTDSDTGNSQLFTGNINITDDVWHHIVLSMASDNTFVLYLDGSSHLSGTRTKWTSGDTHSVSSVRFGNSITVAANSGNQFNGEIDQVRTFNKAISASEVTTLYNENSLVASYRFEGNANDDTRNYDGTASNVTYEYGLNFTPDFVWLKQRDGTAWHTVIDSTRGGSKRIVTNSTIAETTDVNRLTSFDTGGFTLGSDGDCNGDGKDFVAWCWKANGGTTSSNTDGSITSTVQTNTDAGFSIVKYVGNGSSSATVGHNLGAIPDLTIFKQLDSGGTSGGYWNTYLTSNNTVGFLNTDSAFVSNTGGTNGTVDIANMSSTTFGFLNGSSSVNNQNNNGTNYIVYCFKSIDSFSKIGTYTGNGSTNGPIVETGFEPAFIMFKRTDSTGDWRILDNKRSQTNPRNEVLKPNSSEAEESNSTSLKVDFLSNGFQLKSTHSSGNTNNATYLYMAFAADPDTEQPTVAKSFSTVAYTGTGSNKSIEGLGFSPSLLWLKGRSNTEHHYLYDTIRGSTKFLHSTLSNAQGTDSTSRLASFDDDGFSLFTDPAVNGSGQTYVAWAWKADDNEPTINTEGSIDSLVSANANAGFSIVKYTGNNTGSNQTIGHGLSSAPEIVILKALDRAADWAVIAPNAGVGPGDFLQLNGTGAASGSGTIFGYPSNTGVSPTSTVFTVGGSNDSNATGEEYIAYCFHSVSGFSKIGSYTGNGSSSGPTVTTGFQPDWIMIKRTDGANSWAIVDSVRGGDQELYANLSDADNTFTAISFLSTGFQIVNTANGYNANGSTYIYMAFKIN